jgi:hypothetical protein
MPAGFCTSAPVHPGVFYPSGCHKKIMRNEIVVFGFFIIVLMMISGCSNAAPSGTSSLSTRSPVSPVQSISHEVHSIQTFSARDGTSFTLSIDRITTRPRPGGLGVLTVNFTVTNTGRDPIGFSEVWVDIITEHPLKYCPDMRVCNTTSALLSSRDVLYPGIPQKVSMEKRFYDEKDYEALKQGMILSFSTVTVFLPGEQRTRMFYPPEIVSSPSWNIDFAKDVTMLPATTS